MNEMIQRFWQKVDKSGECWLWRGARANRRYQTTSAWFNGRFASASRVSWEIANGPIPEAMYVCHKCDNPLCVRPDHLFLGTPGDNVRDMIRKGRQPSWIGKLTAEQVLAIRALAGTVSQREIARQYGVDQSLVCRIINNAVWRHV